MADLSDVTNALGQLVEAALYPGGSPSGPSPIAGVQVLIQVGWPDPSSLDKMMKARNSMVTIYPRPVERNVTRYPQTWDVGAKQAKTFTLAQAGQAVTIAGAQPAPYYRQNICIFANGKPYIFSTIDGSTPPDIAAGLAALIVVDIPGTSAAGAVLTLPGIARIGALRVGTGAPIVQEVKRQEREFQITVWSPSLDSRDSVAKPIDVKIGLTPRMSLADNTRGRLIYKGSPYTDFDQKQAIFRRDFIVTVEYPTTNMDFAPEVVAVLADFYTGAQIKILATEQADPLHTESEQGIALRSPDFTTSS
jgi:hypothetical protein